MRDAFDEFTAHPTPEPSAPDSSVEGFHGVFALLVAAHRKTLSLLDRIVQGPPEHRLDLSLELRDVLHLQEYAEREHLYPALKRLPSLAHVIADQTDRAKQIRKVMLQIDPRDLGPDGSLSQFERLTDLVKQRVVQSETEFYPRAQDLLGKDKSDQLRRLCLSL